MPLKNEDFLSKKWPIILQFEVSASRSRLTLDGAIAGENPSENGADFLLKDDGFVLKNGLD